MAEHSHTGNYIVITPVKDEGPYVEKTIQSMIGQSLRPRRWIIVDDGSRDATPQLLSQYAAQQDWITIVSVARDRERRPGSAEVLAFLEGYKLVERDEFDFVVKMDCDVELAPNYFETILAKFTMDPQLGIASGVYLEEHNGLWKPVKMPSYHAAGCSKVIRAQCFRDIGGFIPKPCWDTLDEIRAQVTGWKTQHFREATLRHLKTEGAGVGLVRTSMMQGQSYYLTGGGVLFFFFKVLHRVFLGKPFVVDGVLMLCGFLRAWLKGEPKLVSEAEASAYRNLLHRRIFKTLSGVFTPLRTALR
jgi:glycosyltransferase involved in cell wall biosynthesis